MQFVGAIHPPEGPRLDAVSAEAYKVTRVQLRNVLPFMPGLPVTMEHHAIHESINHCRLSDYHLHRRTGGERKIIPTPSDVRRRMTELAKHNPKKAIVGEVIDFFEVPPDGGFYTIFKIYPEYENSVGWMIVNGVTSGLSLTHMVAPVKNHRDEFVKIDHPPIVAYELTITSEPSRPGCYIVAGSRDLLLLHGYKGKLIAGASPDISAFANGPRRVPIMASAADVEQVTKDTSAEQMAEALKHVPEELRSVLAANAEEQRKFVEEAKKSAEEANKRAEEAESKAVASELSAGMLKDQLRTIQDNLGEEYAKSYRLTDQAEFLRSKNPAEVLYGAQNIICAANAGFMRQRLEYEKKLSELRGGDVDRGAKRAAPETPSAPAPAAMDADLVEPPTIVAASKRAAGKMPATAPAVDSSDPFSVLENAMRAAGSLRVV